MNDLIDRMNAVIMQSRLDATACPCDRCERLYPRAALELDPFEFEELWCPGCVDTVAERAQEASDEAYYGGSI